MRPVKILTDSCSDLIKELRDQYDIDYAKMQTVYEGKEQWASLDFEYYTPKELYDIMRAGNRITTTQVPPDEFKRIFTKYLDEGYNIVYIACASKQSNSVFTGEKVAQDLLKNYPDAEIYCIDPLNASAGEGMLSVRAARYRDQGLSAKEITDKILAERNLVNEFFTVQSLTYLHKAGRVKASKAFLGNLLGVKPILTADVNGAQVPISKAKGRQKSLETIVAMLKEKVTDPEEDVYIIHADCKPEEVEFVRGLVEKEIPCKNIYVGYMGPIIGASCGPEAIGVWGFGEEVTFEG
ncbi:MAG: DegV family protein [Clostridia bacterium]|nr:DegV family protein [Clostridia bacterium]